MEAATPAAAGTDLTPAPQPQRVQVATMDSEELQRTLNIAKNLAASGMFNDARDAAKAFAKILLGRDLGLSVMQSMTGIHIVEGRPELAGVTLASFIKQHPTYDYKTREHDEQHCVVDFFNGAELLGTTTYDMEKARKAQLVKDHPKAPWNAHPMNMLFWRCISNGVKFFMPDLTGGIPVYHEGEIERVQNIAEGEGTGEAPGVELPAEVEALLARAQELGHAGLADRATAEMTLAGQPPERIQEWLTMGKAELDAMEDAHKTATANDPQEGDSNVPPGALTEEPEEVDAELVEQTPEERQAAAKELNDLALRKADEADAARNRGEDEAADALEEEATSLRAEAEAMGDPDQGQLSTEF